MANFDTGQDLLANVLRRVGQILPTATATATTDADRLIDAKLYINQAYWHICGLRPWRWGRKDPPTQFASIAEILVSVTGIAGPTVTLAAAIATSMAGRKFMLDNDQIPHRISAHAAASNTLTLVTDYTPPSTSPGVGAGRIFQDELVVATDILAYPQIKEVRSGGDVEVMSESQLNEIAPGNVWGVARRKRYAAFISDFKIRLAPWTNEARLFECAYNFRPSPLDFSGGAGDIPIVPQDHRAVLAWEACYQVAEDRRERERAKDFMEMRDAVIKELESKEMSFARPRSYVPRGHRISGGQSWRGSSWQ